MKNKLNKLSSLHKKRPMTISQKISTKRKLLFMGRGTRVRKK